MKIKSIIKKSAIISILLLIVCSSFTAKAEEATSKSENRFYLGESMKTGWDNGYKNEEKIKEGDPHFGWKIGDFYVEGFTSVVKDDDGDPIFLKNVGDKVKLLFRLDQDLNKLNDNDNLSISEDTNGSDEYFSIAKTNFQHGALIIRKTGYTNAKEEPVIYTDYLSAKTSKDADTEVELCEEGDYEVSLDYEIMDNPRKIFDFSIVPTYTNYKIFFKFSVRNGNCMVYPFDVKTKGELSNSSVTENGFYLDFANSRYLDINIKKEILNKNGNSLSEDIRFNRPAKDGEEYTEEGIYTITANNRYTMQNSSKRIYVGNDKLLKAVATTGLSVKVVQDYINNGAEVKDDGTILLSNHETVPIDESNLQEPAATEDSVKNNFLIDNLIWFIIGGSTLVFIVVIIIIIFAIKKKKRKTKYVNIEVFAEDQEVK